MKLALLLLTCLAFADSKPDWFQKDTVTETDFNFYCEAEGKTEELAIETARATCGKKLCLLFGAEVQNTTITTETLKDVSLSNITSERCLRVRVIGRLDKRKSISCEEDKCTAYVYQLYPKREYDKEVVRLNRELATDSFSDPLKCQTSLEAYSKVRGEKPPQQKSRIEALKAATKHCDDLDFKNTELQEQLRTFLVVGFQQRAIATSMALNQEFQNHAKLEEKIAAFQKYEEIQLASYGKIAELETLVNSKKDRLYAQADPTAYLNELKTCTALTEVVKAWPGDVGGNIEVCSSSHCQTTNILMLRAQYAGCLCNKRAKQTQECTRVVMMQMNESCPKEMSKACLAKVASTVAEY